MKDKICFLGDMVTPHDIKNELESKKFYGKAIREDKMIEYEGTLLIEFNEFDVANIVMKDVKVKYSSKHDLIPISPSDEYKLLSKHIGKSNLIIKEHKLINNEMIKFTIKNVTWVNNKPPNTFPEGTKFYFCFTNLRLDFHEIRLKLNGLNLRFIEAGKDYWLQAKTSKGGKITNVAEAILEKPMSKESLNEHIFSICVSLKILTLNRVTCPIYKFILPGGDSGYIIKKSYPHIGAIDGYRLLSIRNFNPKYVNIFVEKLLKGIHKNKYKWNLVQFSEYLVLYNNSYYIENKIIFLILALETLCSGFLKSKNFNINGMDLETKIYTVINYLNQRKFFIKKKELNKKYFINDLKKSEYRNNLFHEGKLPSYDLDVLKKIALEQHIAWLELSWILALRMLGLEYYGDIRKFTN